jgi:phage-related protein (TIGR01555 family)
MLTTFRRWLAAKLAPNPGPPAPVAAKPRKQLAMRKLLAEALSLPAVDNPYQRTRASAEYRAFPELPPGVLPSPTTFAMDTVCPGEAKRPALALDNAAWGFGGVGLNSGYGGGLWFPGYPYLAELTQISEYREPCETIATEMTRKWFELQSKSGGDKSEEIAQIMAECERLNVRAHFYRCFLLDSEFGRGQIYLNIADADEQKRQLPLEITPEGIPVGSLKSIQSIEPYWSTPYSWNSQYPERDDFYRPTSWYIMGRKTHATRLLTFIGREVPDLLKPAYNFGGISLIQLGEMSVNMWLRTRKAVNDLINNFSVPVLATNLNATLEDGSPEPGGLLARLQVFTLTRNNQAIAAIQKDDEEISFAEATLAGLDKLQAQSQEHMAAVWGIPLVKLTGITPSGLNASSEGEITVWYDRIGSMQVRLSEPNLKMLLNAVQCSLFGKIDDDLVIHWVTLDEPTQKELSEIRKSDADMDAGYINASVISPDEARVRLQSDPDSGYSNLTGPAPEPEQELDENGNPVTGITGNPPESDDNADADQDGGELAGFSMDAAQFEENKHPRGQGGQFGSGGHAATGNNKADRAETQVTVHKEYKFAGQPDDEGHKDPVSKLDPAKIKAAQAHSEKVAGMMGKGAEGEKPTPKSHHEPQKAKAASEQSPRAAQGGVSKAPFVNQFMSGHKNREDDMNRLSALPVEKLQKALQLLTANKVNDEDAKYMKELIRDLLKASK